MNHNPRIPETRLEPVKCVHCGKPPTYYLVQPPFPFNGGATLRSGVCATCAQLIYPRHFAKLSEADKALAAEKRGEPFAGPDLNRGRDNLAEALDCALSFLVQSDQEEGFDTDQALANLRTIARELSCVLAPDGTVRAWLRAKLSEMLQRFDGSEEWKADLLRRADRDLWGEG